MEVELELLTNDTDELQVFQKTMELAKKAKELGFSIKELEIENEDADADADADEDKDKDKDKDEDEDEDEDDNEEP